MLKNLKKEIQYKRPSMFPSTILNEQKGKFLPK